MCCNWGHCVSVRQAVPRGSSMSFGLVYRGINGRRARSASPNSPLSEWRKSEFLMVPYNNTVETEGDTCIFKLTSFSLCFVSKTISSRDNSKDMTIVRVKLTC